MLAATVVLYNSENDIIDNISSFVDYVDKLIVVDNSETKNNKLIEQLLCKDNKIEYHFNGDNLGIARALNIACEYSIKNGYHWLLTMDQDSSFIKFKDYLDCFESLQGKDFIAIVSPNITKKSIDHNKEKCDCSDEIATITSGSFLNLKLFNQIGKFEEKLFIDSVDVDYCLKAKLNGFRVVTFKNIFLKHFIGGTSTSKKLLVNRYKTIRQHNPVRVYYITRNKLYMLAKYKDQFPELYKTSSILHSIFIKKIKKIILYEDNKYKKIKAVFKGSYHFIINKYGRCNHL